MERLQKRNLVDNRWRFHVEHFAEHASRGKWEPYRWLIFVLREIQEAVVKGSARLIINAPPRHGKSEAISHWFPTWFLDWFPDKKVILTSYSDKTAGKWGLAVRDEFMSKTNSRTWTRVRPDKSLTTDWLTMEGGGMRTVGVGGSLTGHGGDLLIVDDPHKNWEEATSPAHQKKIINWFNSTFYTRAEPDASIIIIQTRWSQKDLTGYLLNEHEDDWKLLRLPALAEENDPIGRNEGQALCPERFPTKVLHKIKNASGGGSFMFAGLYQQRPAPLEGGMVKRSWFKRWRELPGGLDRWVQSWDLTFKETGTSYVVGQVWARRKSEFYLVDQIRGRFSFRETLRKIVAMSNKWPQAKEKFIEEAANGAAAISSLEDQIPGLIGVRPKSSKEARLVAISGFIEAGNVYVPDASIADWSDDFIDEVADFPNGSDDDQVDTMTLALDNLSDNIYQLDFTIPDSGSRTNPWEFANAKA